MCHHIIRIALNPYYPWLHLLTLCLGLLHRQLLIQLPTQSPPLPKVTPAVAPLGPLTVSSNFRTRKSDRFFYASGYYFTYRKSRHSTKESSVAASGYTSSVVTSLEDLLFARVSSLEKKTTSSTGPSKRKAHPKDFESLYTTGKTNLKATTPQPQRRQPVAQKTNFLGKSSAIFSTSTRRTQKTQKKQKTKTPTTPTKTTAKTSTTKMTAQTVKVQTSNTPSQIIDSLEALISSLQNLSINNTSTRQHGPQSLSSPEPLFSHSTNRKPLRGNNSHNYWSGFPGRMTSTCATTRSN